MTSSSLPEVELLDVRGLDASEGVTPRVERDERDVWGWWPVLAAVGLAAAFLMTGRSGHHADPSAPPQQAAPAPPAPTALPSSPSSSFSIVMRDSLSGHLVLVDPRGRAVRLAATAEAGTRPLDAAAPSGLDVSSGGLPAGRRPVAVLDKSIVLVPASTSGPPVEVWGGGSNLSVLDGVGTFVAASDHRVATVDDGCTSCTMRIIGSEGGKIEEVPPFEGFQPVSTGSFSPNGRYVAVRFAEEHRPFDGVAIVDLLNRTMEPLSGIGGDDALAMAWSPDSRLFLLGPQVVLRYEPGAGTTTRIPIDDWGER